METLGRPKSACGMRSQADPRGLETAGRIDRFHPGGTFGSGEVASRIVFVLAALWNAVRLWRSSGARLAAIRIPYSERGDARCSSST